MGVRNRSAQKKQRQLAIKKLHEDHKRFSRRKAEHALVKGADPSEERFAKHKNYHVRALAWKKMGKPLPEDATERAKFLAGIHVKESAVETNSEPVPTDTE